MKSVQGPQLARQPFCGAPQLLQSQPQPACNLCCSLQPQPENIKVPVYLHHGALDDMKGFSDPEVCLQLEGQGWRALQPVLQLATLPSPAGMLALSAAAPCSAVCCT